MINRILLVVGIAVLLAMAEIQRLAGQFLSAKNGTFDLGEVTGITALAHRDEWNDWQKVADAPTVLIQAYVILDVVFIACYLIIIWTAIATLILPPVPPLDGRALREIRRQTYLKALLIGLVISDLVEDALLYIAASWLTDERFGYLAIPAAIFSTVKWALTIWLAVSILTAPVLQQGLRAWLRKVATALRVHRLAAVVVAVLAVLSLLPISLVLEQQPDIERAWFDEDGSDAVSAFTAAGAMLLVAFGYLLIGRKRSADYFRAHVLGLTTRGYPRSYDPSELQWRRPPGRLYLLWLSLPVVVLIAGTILWVVRPDLLDARSFWFFLGVTTGIPAISFFLEKGWRWRNTFGNPELPTPQPWGPQNLPTSLFVARAGDLFSILMVSIAALGLTRALTPHIVLAAAGLAAHTSVLQLLIYWTVAVAMIAVAAFLFVRVAGFIDGATFGTALMQPAPVGRWAAFWREFSADNPSATISRRGWFYALVGTGLSVAVIVLCVLTPEWTGSTFGVIALMVLSLGAWTVLVNLVMLALRWRRPLAIFAIFGLRADPIVTLFVVVPILIGQISPVVALHAIDQTAAATPNRLSLSEAFDEWADRTASCTAKVDGQDVRPLVLVAAEGGGIRAATWTAAVLAQVSDDTRCTAESVFLSSGVSGGSVGLAVAANATDGDEMLADVRELSRSTALPTAVTGLVISDPLASATGLRFPTLETPDRWRDRAALIEDSWRAVVPELDRSFDVDPHPPTGYVVLNSTDLRSGCRVSLSQVRLDDGKDAAGDNSPQFTNDGPACKQNTEEPPLTVDLISAYRQCAAYQGDWATSAMLSARFPYVTPSGGVEIGGTPGCAKTKLQLVDGGYAEVTGLGLIADIAPRLADLFRSRNESQPGSPPIVPYVMYIQNSPGGYISQSPRNDAVQLTVPMVGQETKAEQLAASTWIQRIMSILDGNEKPVVVAERRTIIAAISTKPAVNVPLGWGLSQSTYLQLVDDAETQSDVGGCRKSNTHLCLANLLDLQ